MTRDAILQSFTCDREYQCYRGNITFPFWGEILPVILPIGDFEGYDVDTRAVEMLLEMLKYEKNFRIAFAQDVFEYYTTDVFGSFSCGDEYETLLVCPHITSPDQIWPMLYRPQLFIQPHRNRADEAKIVFSLVFDCLWDEEHGFGARYQDWRPLQMGGAGGVA